MSQDADLKAAFAELQRLDEAAFRRVQGDPPGEARLLDENDPEGPVVVTTARSKFLMPREVYEDLKNFKIEGGST